MKSIARSIVSIAMIGWVTLSLSSCNDVLDPKQNFPFGTLTKSSIVGIVVDESGYPVVGASVSVLGSTATAVTNDNGLFAMKDVNVPAERSVVKAVKPGYFTSTRAIKPMANGSTAAQLTMSPEKVVGTVNSNTGGLVSIAPGASVQLPAGGIVTVSGTHYTGAVKVVGRYLNPTSDRFGALTPGGDMQGVSTTGATVALYSFGVVDVKLQTPTGEALQIASDKEAVLSYEINPSRKSTAHATEPLWYFDETTGVWKEEGIATNTGSAFVGTVKHFSSWNCDYRGERANVIGKVVDCNGNPIAGATVIMDGPHTTTDSLGHFEHWIPANMMMDFTAMCGGNLKSPVYQIPKQAAGQTFDVGTMVCPCPAYVSGRILDCNGPADALVVVSWVDPYSTQRSVSSMIIHGGDYRLPVPANAAVTVTAMGLTGVAKSTNATSGIAASVTPVPDLDVCNPNPVFTRWNYLIVNGAPYNNDTLNTDNLTATINVYGIDSALVQIQNTQADSIFVQLSVTAAKVGTYQWGVRDKAGFSAFIRTSNPYRATYFSGSYLGAGFTNITRFDSVPGGLIQGNYAGTVVDSLSTKSVSGTFSVVHP